MHYKKRDVVQKNPKLFKHSDSQKKYLETNAALTTRTYAPKLEKNIFINHLHPGRADRARVLCNPRRGTFNQSMRKLSSGSGGRFSIVSSSLESKSPIIMLGVSETEGIRWFLIMVCHVFQFLYHIYICLAAKR